MKKTLTIAVLLIGTFSLAQVGINTETPDANSDLTLASEDKGLLLNRVELEETTDPAPLTAHVAGMMVYNTATAGDVTPGQYYNDGTKWVRVANGSGGASGAEPWFIQNTTDEATSNSENIYQTGKVAIGEGFDGAVTDFQFEVAGGYKMEKKDALGTSLYGTMTTDAAKSVTNYSITPTHTSYSNISPTHILNTLGETGVSLVFNQMYDDGHFDFYGRNSTTDSNWEMYGKVGADGEDHLRFKHRQASGSGNNRWSSEIFLNKTTGNSFKFYTNTGIQGNYIFPRTNGTAGQVLMTDGAAAATGAQLYWGTLPAAANDWHITGNAGTTAGTNFLGTTDNRDMVFKRNNVVAGVLKANNTSFGVGSLPTTALGSGNAAFGNNALGSTTVVAPGASLNTAIGTSALSNLNAGSGNVAVGWSALEANESGSQNVAIGTNAMRRGTGSASSTAVGYNALLNDQAGLYNTAIGISALQGASQSTSAIAGNTGVGGSSLSRVSTGTFNTGIGYMSGVNITTGSNNTTLGYNAVVPTATGSNQVRIGNAAVTYAGVQVAWTVTSDRRLKNDIKDSNLGLNFIKQLRPVSYIRKNDESKKSEYGFIAQELKETLKNNGVTNSGIISEADDSTMSVRYNDLLAPMVKAIQEQQKIIESLQKRIEELESK